MRGTTGLEFPLEVIRFYSNFFKYEEANCASSRILHLPLVQIEKNLCSTNWKIPLQYKLQKSSDVPNETIFQYKENNKTKFNFTPKQAYHTEFFQK